MPCPYFEPQTVGASPQHGNARLPLIEEYDGVCHSGAEPFAAPQEQRFGCCNHGYSRARCGHFPASETRSAFRYVVLKDSEKVLEIICIEERDYTPIGWHHARYLPESGTLEAEIADACMCAQALAFCRSYVGRFRGRP